MVKNVLEALAVLEHQQFRHWIKYQVEHMHLINWGKWIKQANTAYALLSEKEKESDREWARKVLATLGIYPNDFARFFEAMGREMKRHEPKKGETWKDDKIIHFYYHRYSSLPSAPIGEATAEYLPKLLKKAVQEYFEHGALHQLVDIASICAMIWCRGE